MYQTSKSKTQFFIIFSTIILSAIVLEIASGIILEKQAANKLAIFDGILVDEQDVYKTVPNYRGRWEANKQFSVEVRTNNHGYRENFDFEDSDVDVAFMGDSFTFGHGVNVENRYSNIVAKNFPNQKIACLSYNNGFQPEHYEYFLQKHPDLKPKLLFIGLYLGNDLDSDVKETLIKLDDGKRISKLQIPYRSTYRGTIINAPSGYRYSWLSSLIEKSNLIKLIAININSSMQWRHILFKEATVVPNSPNRLSTELGELDDLNLRAINSLKRIARIVTERGGKLNILLIPQNFYFGSENPHIDIENKDKINMIMENGGLLKVLVEVCKREGLKCHDLSTILTKKDYFKMDAHWNELGHEKVGKYISQIIEKIGI